VRYNNSVTLRTDYADYESSEDQYLLLISSHVNEIKDVTKILQDCHCEMNRQNDLTEIESLI